MTDVSILFLDDGCNGRDTLVGGTGDDRLEGGRGDDVYVYARGQAGARILRMLRAHRSSPARR